MNKLKYSVDQLVPHSAGMSLLTEINSYTDEGLEATVNITFSSMFATDKGVPAWIGLEYMAQAVAAYSGTLERKAGGKPKLGFLLGTRKYLCNTDIFNFGENLTITVECELMADNGLSVFQCLIKSTNVTATAQLKVFQPEDAEQFLKDSSSE